MTSDSSARAVASDEMRETTLPRVEFFVRAAMTGAGTRQYEVLDRLEEFEATGRVAAVSTHAWQGRIRVSVDAGHESQAFDWFERFERWADRNDADLSPFFERHERTSLLAGEEYEELIFPVICLAVTRDGSIDEVVPRREDDEVVDVEDCLDRLAALDPDPGRVAVPAGE